MRIKMRSLRWLAENSTMLENGGVQYNAPVNFFEHVARCTDWKAVVDKINRRGGVSIGRGYVTNVIGKAILDHYVFAKNVVIESLDTELCVSHKLWISKPQIGFGDWGNNYPIIGLRGKHTLILDKEVANRQVSTIRSMVIRVLTDDPKVLVEGKPHLIIENYIACQHVEDFGTWRPLQDCFVTRESEEGKIAEREYRRLEQENMQW